MKDNTVKKVITNLIWAIAQVYKFNRYYIVGITLDCIIKGISPIISLLLTNSLVNKIQLHNCAFKSVIIVLGALILFEAINELCSSFIELKLSSYKLNFNVFNNVKILNKISELDCKDFEDSSTYDLIDRTQCDATNAIMEYLDKFISMISTLITSVSYVVIIIRYNIIICAAMIVIPIVRYIFQKKYNLLEYEVIKSNTENDRRSSYISYLLTNAEYFKEIKMFNLFSFFIEKYKKLKSAINQDLIHIYNKRTIVDNVLNILEVSVNFLILLQIIFQTFDGRLLIGQFILYNSSINDFKTNLMSVFSLASSLYKDSSMINQVKRFFKIPKEAINEDGIQIDDITSITLENVCYKYKDVYTLKNINLTLEKGDFMVIMGYNGAGKSTLMKVLMGIYNDYEGNIYVNGMDFRLINKECYRKLVGAMFQGYIKYETSIPENVWYGNLEYLDDMDKLKEILSKVGLDSFINDDNQKLGYQFDDGREISIGQWQKLALARTIAKPADLYIFDEPNSSLDLISEDTILNTIISETHDKIGIMIMHRFNKVISTANKIIILNDGCIDDMGTHDELLSHKGIYYELYSLQNNI